MCFLDDVSFSPFPSADEKIIWLVVLSFYSPFSARYPIRAPDIFRFVIFSDVPDDSVNSILVVFSLPTLIILSHRQVLRDVTLVATYIGALVEAW